MHGEVEVLLQHLAGRPRLQLPAISKNKKTIKVVATDAAKNVRTASWYFMIR